jgi:ABC-2 type transport system permease protein
MIIAAIVGMAVGFIILMMSTFVNYISVDWIATALDKINFINYYVNFTYGLLSITDIVFFLSVTGLFIFFTVRVLEKRRWS